MRVAQPVTFFSSLLSLPLLTDAILLDCHKIRDNKVEWDLSKLGGNHTVHVVDKTTSGAIKTIRFAIDICKPLKPPSKGCPPGTRICASEFFGDKDGPVDDWPIAGNFQMSNGKPMNPVAKRLKDSEAQGDEGKEGVRISVEGGTRGKEKRNQAAHLEFICDPNKTGLEGFPDKLSEKTQDDDGDGDDPPNPDKGHSLKFVSYKAQSWNKQDADVLKVKWLTKFACEKAGGGKGGNDDKDDKDEDSSNSGWGFFTWFIIILFLAVASYLIFGSWLNYNRYGARGWDLLPHGDTIRDVPYLLKEWGRRVVSGGGSRGGYSRV